jgi:hypothetical protein
VEGTEDGGASLPRVVDELDHRATAVGIERRRRPAKLIEKIESYLSEAMA